MAGRPQLEIGTYGKIRYRDLPDGRVQARALFRDKDGHTRPVARMGGTKTAADRALKAAMRDRQRVAGDATIRSDMRLTDLADAYLERIDASDRAISTKQQYRKIVKAYLRPTLGQLRIQEATVSACDSALTVISSAHGLAVAKSSRAVLSGMMSLAARHGAVAHNPVRDTEPIRGAATPKKGAPRALTPEQTDTIADGLRTLDRAIDLDLPDLVDFALATGARIGELLACRQGVNREGEPLLDLDAGTWEVNATVIRVGGVRRLRTLQAKTDRTWEEEEELHALTALSPGLHIQHRTKTDAGWRVLALPPFAVAMLKRRQATEGIRGPEGVIFNSPGQRALRDPTNTAGDLKECLAALDFVWPTFHTFRKTVLTRMDQAGFSAREAADQAGHSKPSMTQNKYFGRGVASTRAATLLDR